MRRLVQRGAYPALLEEAAQGRGTAPLLSAGGFDTGHYSWEGLWGGGRDSVRVHARELVFVFCLDALSKACGQCPWSRKAKQSCYDRR